MGYWGNAPWDNDYAADWCADVFDKTRLHEEIAACLARKVDESNRDEMRAAIMLFISLGRVYVYDADKYEEHLELALLKARELLKHWIEGGWDNDQHIGENISHEIKILEMRKLGEAAHREPPAEELRSYWLRWM